MRTLLFEEIGVEKERRRKKLNLILSVPSLLSSCMHLCHRQWNNLKIISLLGEQNQQTIYILSLPWTSISLSFPTIRSEKWHSALHHGVNVTYCQKLVARWRWSFKWFWYSFKGSWYYYYCFPLRSNLNFYY